MAADQQKQQQHQRRQSGHYSGDEFTQMAPPNPPDRGYGWLVVFGSFLCNALVDGCCFSYGVLQEHIATSFQDASPSLLAMPGSFLTGTYLLMGPISSALANMFGCRTVVMAGAALSTAAFCAAAFAPGIEIFIGLFGFLGGIGFGLIYLPAVVTVGFWFEKRRAFATGVAVCGSGIGTAIFALLSDLLIDRFAWRGALVIIAGLLLNCALAGSLFMPLEKYYSILVLRERKRRARGQPLVSGHIFEKTIENKKRERKISSGSLNGWIITTTNKIEPPPPDYDERPMLSTDAVHRIAESVLRKKSVGLQLVPQRRSLQFVPQTPAKNNIPQLLHDYAHSQASLGEASCVSYESSVPDSCDTASADDIGKAMASENVREAISKTLLREMHRPMYRKDVFHSGSLHQLSEYVRSRLSVAGTRDYYKSVTSIPPEVGATSAPMRSAIRHMLDLSIMKSATFCLLLLTSVLTMLGFLQFYQFIKMYAVSQGVPNNQATMLVFMIGVTNTVGRIISGWASDRPWADCLWINNIALIGSGVATAAIPMCKTFVPMLICSCVYGFFISAWVSLRTILVVDLMGLDRLTNAFGLLLLFQGFGIIIGPPLGSAIDQLDPSSNYSLSFYLAGCLLLASGVLGIPLRLLSRWEQRRVELRGGTPAGGTRRPSSVQRSILVSSSQLEEAAQGKIVNGSVDGQQQQQQQQWQQQQSGGAARTYQQLQNSAAVPDAIAEMESCI